MFENGQGDIVDENGNEAMDWEEEVNPHNTETLSNFTQYSGKQPMDLDMTDPKLPERMDQLEKTINASSTPKNKYADYSDSQKTLFMYYLQLKLLSAARKAAINDEHKTHLIEFFDENPHARGSDAVEDLTKNFEGFTLKDTVVGKFISTECNLSIKVITRHPVARNQCAKIKERREWVETWSKINMDYTKSCIFIDESAFDINMKPPTARSARGTPAIVTSPSARTISHTILGAISVCGVVNMEIRVPLTPKIIKVVGAQKRKATAMKAKTPGTKAGHFTNFIKKNYG
ncbi:hypothetical protein EDC94DRAFT_647413 [Helicostylum pulchrum]|nr:hypothetical protein EDC94DRAFT_647413 [Helicostylum pulchrum]